MNTDPQIQEENPTPPSTSATAIRSQERKMITRLMGVLVLGSGIIHGLTIALLYLPSVPTQSKVQPEPELEIVIDSSADLQTEPEVTEVQADVAQTASTAGGDDQFKVATLLAPQAIEADPEQDSPIQDISEADLKESPQPKEPPKPKKQSQEGIKDGDPNGTKERGLAKEGNKGVGAGDAKDGKGGNSNQTVTPTSKNKPEEKKPEVKKLEEKKPEVKKPEEKKETKVAAKSPTPTVERRKKSTNNYGYDRDQGERLATGTKGRFIVEYDDNGRVKGGKLVGTTGDAELDAAQLRDFNRTLENEKLRKQLESRDASQRDRPIKFVFEGEGQTAEEREQIQRNRDLTIQQENRRQAEREAAIERERQPAPQVGDIPLPADVPQERSIPPEPAPEAPASAPASVEAAPSQPAPAPVEAAPAPVEEAPAPVEAPVPVEAPASAPVEEAPASSMP